MYFWRLSVSLSLRIFCVYKCVGKNISLCKRRFVLGVVLQMFYYRVKDVNQTRESLFLKYSRYIYFE